MTRFFVIGLISLIIAPHWPEEALAHGVALKEILTTNLVDLNIR